MALAAAGVIWLTLQAGRLPWIALLLAATFGIYGLLRKLAPLGALEGLTLETLLLSPFAAAKYVLASGVWLVVAAAALFTGAVLAPIIMTYPAIIIRTAWLLHTRAAWLMNAFTAAATMGTGLVRSWA